MSVIMMVTEFEVCDIFLVVFLSMMSGLKRKVGYGGRGRDC
jgi:hypothetical protein